VLLAQDQQFKQTQTQRIAPHQIQANLLLQCSTQELLQAISLEQQQNPALDSAESDSLEDVFGCPSCPPFGLCRQCAERREDHASEREIDTRVDTETAGDDAAGGGDPAEEREAQRREWELMRAETRASAAGSEGDFDPLLLVRAPVQLSEQLLLHLRATSADPMDASIAEYLVNCLDDSGYLRLDIDEACAVLRVPCTRVSAGVQRLQACDPPGIGARDLRECLLLQMRARAESDESEEYDPVALTLLTHHWDALTQRRHVPLARSLGVTPARLELALRFIRERLTPHPAGQFRVPWDHCPNTESRAIRPDVMIRRTESGFDVDLLGLDGLDLHVNPQYQRLYDSLRAARNQPQGTRRRLSDHERHVVEFVERADLFVRNIQQRRRTIVRITRAIVEQQQGFLETGQRSFLRSMTRTRLAQDLGLHESTVSRALLHKFVQLPAQEVVPFDIFFENAVSVKDAVAELIAQESSDSPLTDQAIKDILQKRGVQVARRTVVKYREELRLPASYLRRRR
jgi:RNA polymerase sigma-54 factor